MELSHIRVIHQLGIIFQVLNYVIRLCANDCLNKSSDEMKFKQLNYILNSMEISIVWRSLGSLNWASITIIQNRLKWKENTKNKNKQPSALDDLCVNRPVTWSVARAHNDLVSDQEVMENYTKTTRGSPNHVQGGQARDECALRGTFASSGSISSWAQEDRTERATTNEHQNFRNKMFPSQPDSRDLSSPTYDGKS